MTDKIVEQVAERLEGRKLFRVYAQEQIYYAKDVYATSKEEARLICEEEGDWGDIVDGDYFEVTTIEEVK